MSANMSEYSWLFEKIVGGLVRECFQGTPEDVLQWAKEFMDQHTASNRFTYYRIAPLKKFTKTPAVKESAHE